jgi:hypothetical protein
MPTLKQPTKNLINKENKFKFFISISLTNSVIGNNYRQFGKSFTLIMGKGAFQ